MDLVRRYGVMLEALESHVRACPRCKLTTKDGGPIQCGAALAMAEEAARLYRAQQGAPPRPRTYEGRRRPLSHRERLRRRSEAIMSKIASGKLDR